MIEKVTLSEALQYIDLYDMTLSNALQSITLSTGDTYKIERNNNSGYILILIAPNYGCCVAFVSVPDLKIYSNDNFSSYGVNIVKSESDNSVTIECTSKNTRTFRYMIIGYSG